MGKINALKYYWWRLIKSEPVLTGRRVLNK
jgi:hypothetical protein